METIQLAHGQRVTLSDLTGVTANTTGIEQKAHGHNAIILFADLTVVAGEYSVKIQGKSPSGTFMDLYDHNGNLMEMSSITADKAQLFVGIPEYFRLVVTEDTNGGTLTVGYELMSV